MEAVRLKSNARKSTHSGKPSPGNQEQRRLRESLRWRKQDANSNVNLPQRAPQKTPLKVSQKAPQKAPPPSCAGKRTGWSLSARARAEDKEEDNLLIPIDLPERKEPAANGAVSCEGHRGENINGLERQDMHGLSEHEKKNQDQRSLWSLFSDPKLTDKKNGDLNGGDGTSLSESGGSNENNSKDPTLTSEGMVKPKSFAIKPSKNIFSKMKPLKKSRNIFANFGKSADVSSKSVKDIEDTDVSSKPVKDRLSEISAEKSEIVKDAQKKSEIDEITGSADISEQKRLANQLNDRTCEPTALDTRTKADKHDDILKDFCRTEEPLEEPEHKLPEETTGDVDKQGDGVREQSTQGVLREEEASNEKHDLRTVQIDLPTGAQDSQPPSLPDEQIWSDSLSDISCDMDEGGGLVIDEQPPTLSENTSELTSKNPDTGDTGHVLRVWSLQSQPGDTASHDERTTGALDCVETQAAEKDTLYSDDIHLDDKSQKREQSGVDALVKRKDDLNEMPLPRLEEDVSDAPEKSPSKSANDAVETSKNNVADVTVFGCNKPTTDSETENVTGAEIVNDLAVQSRNEDVAVTTAKESEAKAEASALSISYISIGSCNNRTEVQPGEQHIPTEVEKLAENKIVEDGEDKLNVHLNSTADESLDEAEASDTNKVSPIRNIFSLFSKKGETTSTSNSETVDSENLMHVAADSSKQPQIEESPPDSTITTCNSEKQSTVPRSSCSPQKQSSLEGTSEIVCAVQSLNHEDPSLVPTNDCEAGQDNSKEMIVEGNVSEQVTLVEAQTDDPAAIQDRTSKVDATEHMGESLSLQTDTLDILNIPNLILELQEQNCAEQRTDDISHQPPKLLPEKEITPISQHEEDQIEDLTFFSFDNKDSLYSFAKKSKLKMRKKPQTVANKIPIQKPTIYKPIKKKEDNSLEAKIRSLERHFLWSMDIQGLTEIAHPSLRKRGLNLKKIAENNETVIVKEEHLYRTNSKKHKPKPKYVPKPVLNEQNHLSKETKPAKDTKSTDKTMIKNSDSLAAKEWEILSDSDGQKSDRPSLKLKFITKSKATSTPQVQQSPLVLSTKPKTLLKPAMSSTSKVNINIQQLQVRPATSNQHVGPRPVNHARPEKSMHKVIKLEAVKPTSSSCLQDVKPKSKKMQIEKPPISLEPPEDKSPRPPIEESLPFKPFEKPVVSKKSAFVSDALEDLLEGASSSKQSGSLITPGSMAASTAQVVFKVPSKQSHSVKTLAMALKRQKPVEVAAKRERSHQFIIDDESGLLKKKKRKKNKHKHKEDMEHTTSMEYGQSKPVMSCTQRPPDGYVLGTGPDDLVKKLPTPPFSYHKKTYPKPLLPKKREEGHQGFLQVRNAFSASDKPIIKKEPEEVEPFDTDDNKQQSLTTSQDSGVLVKQESSKTYVPKPPVKREADSASPETSGPVEKSPRTCGESCRLGCICDCIQESRSVQEMTVHCRQENCMLTCKCQKSSFHGTIRTRRRSSITSDMLFYDDTYKFWKSLSTQLQSRNKKVKLLDFLSPAEKELLQTTSARTRVFESDKVISAKEKKRKCHKKREQSDIEAKLSDPTVESAPCLTLPPLNHTKMLKKEEMTTSKLNQKMSSKKQFILLSDLHAVKSNATITSYEKSSKSDLMTPESTCLSTESVCSSSKAAVVTAGMSTSTAVVTCTSSKTNTQAKTVTSAASLTPKGSVVTAKRNSTLLPVAKQYYLGNTLMNLILLPNGNRVLVPAKTFPPVVVVNGSPSVPSVSQTSSTEKPPNSSPPVSLFIPVKSQHYVPGVMQAGNTSQQPSTQVTTSSSGAKNVQAGKGDPRTTQVFRKPLANVPSTSAAQTQPEKICPSDGTDNILPRAPILQKAVTSNVSSSALKGVPKVMGPVPLSAPNEVTSGKAPMHFEFTSSGLKTTIGSNHTEAPSSVSKLPVHLTLQGNPPSGKADQTTVVSKLLASSSKPVIEMPDLAVSKTTKPTSAPLGSSTDVVSTTLSYSMPHELLNSSSVASLTSSKASAAERDPVKHLREMPALSPLKPTEPTSVPLNSSAKAASIASTRLTHPESLRPSGATSLPISKPPNADQHSVNPVKAVPALSPLKSSEPPFIPLNSSPNVASPISTPPSHPELSSPSAVTSLPTPQASDAEKNSVKTVNSILDFTQLKSAEQPTNPLNSSPKAVDTITTSTSPPNSESSGPSSLAESVASVCHELSKSPKRNSPDASNLKMPAFSCYVVVAGKKNQEFIKVAIHTACQWKNQKSDVMKAVAKLVKSKEGCKTADVGDDLQLQVMYMGEKEGAVIITTKKSKKLKETKPAKQSEVDGISEGTSNVAEKAESKTVGATLELSPISSGVQTVSTDVQEKRTKSPKDESESSDKMIKSLEKDKSGGVSSPLSVDEKDEVAFTDMSTGSLDREPSLDVSTTPAVDKTVQDSGKLSSSLPEFDKLSAIVKRSSDGTPYVSLSKPKQGAQSYDWLNESVSSTKPSISQYKGMKGPWFSSGSPSDGVKIVLERKKPKFSPKGKGIRYSPAKSSTSTISRDTSSNFTNLKPLLRSEEISHDSGDNINGSESVFDQHLRDLSADHDDENDKELLNSRDSAVCELSNSNAEIKKKFQRQKRSSPDKDVADTAEYRSQKVTDEQQNQENDIERETSNIMTSVEDGTCVTSNAKGDAQSDVKLCPNDPSKERASTQQSISDEPSDDDDEHLAIVTDGSDQSDSDMDTLQQDLLVEKQQPQSKQELGVDKAASSSEEGYVRNVTEVDESAEKGQPSSTSPTKGSHDDGIQAKEDATADEMDSRPLGIEHFARFSEEDTLFMFNDKEIACSVGNDFESGPVPGAPSRSNGKATINEACPKSDKSVHSAHKEEDVVDKSNTQRNLESSADIAASKPSITFEARNPESSGVDAKSQAKEGTSVEHSDLKQETMNQEEELLVLTDENNIDVVNTDDEEIDVENVSEADKLLCHQSPREQHTGDLHSLTSRLMKTLKKSISPKRLPIKFKHPLMSSTSSQKVFAPIPQQQQQQQLQQKKKKTKKKSKRKSPVQPSQMSRQFTEAVIALKYSNKSKEDAKSLVQNEDLPRSNHNLLERRRREELRSQYRTLATELGYDKNTAKIKILQKAKEVIENAKRQEKTLAERKERAQKRNRVLTFVHDSLLHQARSGNIPLMVPELVEAYAQLSDQEDSSDNEESIEFEGSPSQLSYQERSSNTSEKPRIIRRRTIAKPSNQGPSGNNPKRGSLSTQGRSVQPSNKKRSGNKHKGVSDIEGFINEQLSNQNKSDSDPHTGYKFDGSVSQLTNKLGMIASETSLKTDIKAEETKDASKDTLVDNASSDEEALPIECYVSSSDEHEDVHHLVEDEEGAYSDDGFILDSDDDEGGNTGMGSRGVTDGGIADYKTDDEMEEADKVQRTGDVNRDGVLMNKEAMPIKINLDDPDFTSSSDSEVEEMDVDLIENIVDRIHQESQTVNKNITIDSSDEEPVEVTSVSHRDNRGEKIVSKEKSLTVVKNTVEPPEKSHIIDLSTKVRETKEKEQSKLGSFGKPVNSVQFVEKDDGESSKSLPIDKPAFRLPTYPAGENAATKKQSPRKIVSVIDEIMARLGGKEASSESKVTQNQVIQDKAAVPSTLVKETLKHQGRASEKLTDPQTAKRSSALQTAAKQAPSLSVASSKPEHVTMQQTLSKQQPSRADTSSKAPNSQVKPQQTGSAQKSLGLKTGTPAKDSMNSDKSSTQKGETKSTLPRKGALSDLISSVKSRVFTDYSSSDSSEDDSDAEEDLPSSQSEVRKETSKNCHDGHSDDDDAEDEDSSDDDSSDDNSVEEGEIKEHCEEELVSEKPSTSQGQLLTTSKATVVGDALNSDFSDDSSDDSSLEDGEIREDVKLKDNRKAKKSEVTAEQTPETKFAGLNVSEQQNDDSLDSDDGSSISSIEMNLASDDDFDDEEDAFVNSKTSVSSMNIKKGDDSNQSKLVPSTSRRIDIFTITTERNISPKRNLFDTVLSESRGSATSKETNKGSDLEYESLSDIPLDTDSGDSQAASATRDSQTAGYSGTPDPILDEDVSFLDVEKNSDGTLNVVLKGDYDNKKLDELFEKPGVMDYLMSAAAKKQLE